MKDRVAAFSSKGLKAAYICSETQGDADMVRGVVNGSYQLMFFSPEMLLSRRWRKVLLSETFQENLTGMAVDEAHCVKSWCGAIDTFLISYTFFNSTTLQGRHIQDSTGYYWRIEKFDSITSLHYGIDSNCH